MADRSATAKDGLNQSTNRDTAGQGSQKHCHQTQKAALGQDQGVAMPARGIESRQR